MRKNWMITGVAMLITLTILATGIALAASLALSLDWWTVDGGGGTAIGGDYTLSGTSGQPDAGVMSGGDYTLGGGFWGGGSLAGPEFKLHLPLVVK